MIAEILFERGNVISLLIGLGSWLLVQICIYYYKLRKKYQVLKDHGIPGPEPSLFGGNFYDLQKGHCLDLHKEWTEKYGKTYGFYAGLQVLVVTSDLDMLKQVFFENNDVFTERQDNVIKPMPLTDSLLFARHQRWKMMRKHLTPAFTFYGSKSQESQEPIIESVSLFMDFLDKRRLDSADKKTIKGLDILNIMKSMALHLISNIAIKLKDIEIEEKNKNVQALDWYLEQTGKGVVNLALIFPFLATILTFISNHFEIGTIMKKIHKEVSIEINDGLDFLSGKKHDQKLASIYQKEQPPAVIHRMIKLLHEGKITHTEIMGNVEALLFAGYDTTSTTLTYIFWTLAKHQGIQEKLRLDLMRTGTESVYLMQVINEVMRLYPTVLTFTRRKSNRDCKVGNYIIPKNVEVVYNAAVLHHSAELWPDPAKFDPERFREGIVIHPCAFAPFGLGERRCIGYKLSFMEMKHVVCSLLSKYRLKLVAPQELALERYAFTLTKPVEIVRLDLESLGQNEM